FCYPGVCRSKTVARLLGTEIADLPEFGHKAHVPLLNGRTDRTEVDMRLGQLFVEAKLTESDFQTKARTVVETYLDLRTVFNLRALPTGGKKFVCYQLIRNVLAAHASGASFCVIADARRPDLIEAWHAIMRCVRHSELRTRCQVLTWQELSTVLPRKLQEFLDLKYGITENLKFETCHLVIWDRAARACVMTRAGARLTDVARYVSTVDWFPAGHTFPGAPLPPAMPQDFT